MTFSTSQSWISYEFSQVRLGDARLDKRLATVSNALLENPGCPIHQACESWDKAKGAYRLLGNEKLTSDKLMEAHQQRTKERVSTHDSSLVFAIQDTTEMDYTHHPKTEELGTLSKNISYDHSRKGFLVHSTLIVDPSGIPLGLIDQKIYKRTESKKNHKERPITDKESYRWIESLRNTKNRLPEKKCVTVCDREADIFEFLFEAEKLSAPVIVRSSIDRLLVKNPKEGSRTLRPFMQKIPLATSTTVNVPSKPGQAARTAELEVRHSKVTLKPPQRTPRARHDILTQIELCVVWLHEPNPPEGCAGLDWMLLTTLDIPDAAAALLIGQYYKLRWQIECYHRILKSGCRVESSRLGSYKKLEKYISIQSVIAIRLFFLTHTARTQPHETCETILTPDEWQALDSYVNKRCSPGKEPPTCREAIRMIASLGGFLGRKGDGEPGMTYIWRGWEKLETLVEMRKCLLGT